MDKHNLPEMELYVEGERTLGHYTLRIARHSSSGWSPTIPPLDVTITNRRMFMRPASRKAHKPASIPQEYISQVKAVELGIMHGLCFSLSTGHYIYVYIDKENGDRLLEDIHAMKMPAPRFQFDDSLVQDDITRLISFINSL
jgi:hypothetical protein